VDVAAAADYEGPDGDLKAVRAFIARKALAPFFPRYEGDYRCDKKTNLELIRGYLKALQMRRTCHEMLSVFGGKMPHNVDIVPGGSTSEVTADKIATFMGKLQEVAAFIEDVYAPAVFTAAAGYGDYFEIGAGCRRFLSYGAFNMDAQSSDPLTRSRLLPQGFIGTDGKLAAVSAGKISEEVACSRYADECAAPPAEGKTVPEPEKAGAYSWLKAPRYDGAPAEVGPLARALVGYAAGDAAWKAQIDPVLKATRLGADKLVSVLGRHLARLLESRILVAGMMAWLKQLTPGQPTAVPLTIPAESSGAGLTEGPRGALGHWIQIKDKVIARYQLVVPTTWNGSPRDRQGTPGPIEQALQGTKVKDCENPFEIVRIIRSFDPCLACSVHVLTPKGAEVGVYRLG
jgi:hydrogenase large subunit